MILVNPSFNIQAPEIDFEAVQLFAEAGPMGISIVVLDKDNCFKAVVTYAFTGGTQENDLAEKFKEIFSSEILLQKQYHKTHIFWSFAQSILVPAELMNADGNHRLCRSFLGTYEQRG